MLVDHVGDPDVVRASSSVSLLVYIPNLWCTRLRWTDKRFSNEASLYCSPARGQAIQINIDPMNIKEGPGETNP